MDPMSQFKDQQRATWSSFATLENLTGTVAPGLARFAGIAKGAEVLDVGCGTGVVALTAARLGARVTGVDLTPALIAHAKDSSALTKLEIDWHEGDAEALSFPDGRFDVVVSQFGHMFAPRPAVAIAEMLRVLRPGGTIAFSTWPPELLVGRMFSLLGRYAPPPPPGASPPSLWGDPSFVRERLGEAVRDLTFTTGTLWIPVLSPQHYRLFMGSFGPGQKLLAALDAADPTKAAALRSEMEALAAPYFEDNAIRQDFLMTRATKR